MVCSTTAVRIGLLVALLSAACPPPVAAHTAWANGQPVPEWVRNACCGPDDVHHLAPSEVERTPGGFAVEGIQRIVPWSKVLPSEDGEYWIFYRNFADGTQYVFCFFAPPEGS